MAASAGPRDLLERGGQTVVRLAAPGSLVVAHEPTPIPGPGEVLLHVRRVGLCGSDRHWYRVGAIGDAGLARPLVLGHEIVAEVVDGPRRGERVVVEPSLPCGNCETCHAGLGHLCPSVRFAGHGVTDGGLREAMAWPVRALVTIPAALSDDDAVLLEPTAVALHALDLGRPRIGRPAAVVGCGPIGVVLVGLLRLAGAMPIVAVEPLPHRLEAARAWGADVTLAPGEGHAGLPLADVAFEVAGEDGAVAEAISLLRPGGRLVLVGIPEEDRSTLPAAAARRKGLTVTFSRRAAVGDLRRAAELAAQRQLPLGRLITHRFPLGRAPEAFAALTSRLGLKVVVGSMRLTDPSDGSDGRSDKRTDGSPIGTPQEAGPP
jgi:L-iditol 2-dehydrogenase